MARARPGRELALASSVLGLVGLLLLWPLLVSPSTRTVDAWFAPSQLLTLDLFTRGLVEEGRLVGESVVLGWPQGGWLSIVGWCYLPLTVPAALLGLSTVAVVNLGVLLQLMGAGLGCYLLARRLGVGVSAATAVSAYYAYHPFSLHQLENGQFTELCHWGPPLMALLLLRLAERPAWGATLALALVSGLVVSSSPYNAMSGLLIIAALGGWLLWREPGERAVVARRLGLAALAVALGSLPFVVYFSVLPSGHDGILWPNQHTPELTLGAPRGGYATLLGWLLPERWIYPLVARLGEPLPDPAPAVAKEHALGWIGMALAGLAALRARAPLRPDAPGTRFWLAPLALCGVLAGGYFLMLGPHLLVDFLGRPVWLPLRVLYELLPQVRAFASSYRLAGGVILCVALMAGMGLQRLSSRRPRGQRWGLTALVGLALVGEGLLTAGAPYPLPTMDLRPLQVHRDLAQLDGGGVLEIPWWPTEATPNSQLLAFRHLTHRHPVHHSEQGPPREQTPTALVLRIDRLRGPTPSNELASISEELPATWFVLHQRALPPHELVPIRALLEEVAVVERVYPDDGVQLYRAREPGGSQAILPEP